MCDREGALLILDEMITGFRWHERGAQYLYSIRPDLSTFGKALANGFPLSALAGRREIMRLGGFAADADRVFLLSQTAGAQPWALAAMMAVIDTFQRDQVATRLLQIGQQLRKGVEKAVADAGLSAYFQLRGRDCNLVYVARDGEGRPSQEFRTLVLQEFLEWGILAPSFVVSAAHDSAAIDQNSVSGGRPDARLSESTRPRNRDSAARTAGSPSYQVPRVSRSGPRRVPWRAPPTRRRSRRASSASGEAPWRCRPRR